MFVNSNVPSPLFRLLGDTLLVIIENLQINDVYKFERTDAEETVMDGYEVVAIVGCNCTMYVYTCCKL